MKILTNEPSGKGGSMSAPAHQFTNEECKLILRGLSVLTQCARDMDPPEIAEVHRLIDDFATSADLRAWMGLADPKPRRWMCPCGNMREAKELEAFVPRLGYPVRHQETMQLNCVRCDAITTHLGTKH